MVGQCKARGLEKKTPFPILERGLTTSQWTNQVMYLGFLERFRHLHPPNQHLGVLLAFRQILHPR